MNDKIFFDSNILIYAYSKNEIEKQAVSRNLITKFNSYISTQVLQELTNIITRKFHFTFDDTQKAIIECCQNNRVFTNTDAIILKSCQLAFRYKFSFFDSLIIASAIESDCKILYSEDLQSGQVIEETVTIVNPFVSI
ncbi:PIN domain-containing protein [Imperialibacter sp. EC-SDR9]|nr:putative nucleic acid-binding protein [Imperialibacter sp. 89]VVT30179.1 conserved hypothetical protein [Imperialibacter sp. EC-SDR9]